MSNNFKQYASMFLIIILGGVFLIWRNSTKPVEPEVFTEPEKTYYELRLKKVIQYSEPGLYSGYSNYLKNNNLTIKDETEKALEAFEAYEKEYNKDGMPLTTFTGHQVYIGNYKQYTHGIAPEKVVRFIISGSTVIPLNYFDINDYNKYIYTGDSILYKEGTTERIYLVENQAEVDKMEDAYAQAQKILSGEVAPEKGQLILDGKLLPCSWKEEYGDYYIPMKEIIPYLMTGSSINETDKTLYLVSNYEGCKSRAVILPSLSSSEAVKSRFNMAENGEVVIRNKEGAERAINVELPTMSYAMKINSLIDLFGWEFYMDENENVMVIVTDESNLTQNYIVRK